MTTPSRAAATIALDRLASNLRAVRSRCAPRTRVLAVVKADAYGHGADDAARSALGEGAGVLCVATAREGAALRGTIPRGTRILVMGPLDPGEPAI